MAKNFTGINNPAAKSVVESKFISDAEPEQIQQEQTPPKKKKEFKSRRFQALFYPSLFAELEADAERQGESVNRVLNDILRKYYFTKE